MQKGIVAAAATVLVVLGNAGGALAHPQTTWAPVGRKPLTDRQAAAQVTHRREQRAMNAAANRYYVTAADLRYFRTARNPISHQTEMQFNPWNAYVDGRSHLRNPSTDDLIQWAAHKWGIPEDWLRALTVFESNWQMNMNGDLSAVANSWLPLYPPSAHSIQGPNMVYESVGIGQIKWLPDNSVNWGMRYLRYKSTAFQLDYMGAEIRFYYDGKCSWCGPNYHAGDGWQSLAAWNEPSPWGGATQESYIAQVEKYLAIKPWLSPYFPQTVFTRT